MARIGRRASLGIIALFITAALAALYAMSIPGRTHNLEGGEDLFSSETEPVVPVSEFTQSIGVNTHVNFTAPMFAGYEDLNRVKESLLYLGVRHIRDGGYYSTPEHVSRLAELARDANVKVNFTMGSGGSIDLTNLRLRLLQFDKEAPGHLFAVEGANEINNLFQADNWRVTYAGQTTDMCKRDFGAAVVAQRDLYTMVKSERSLEDVAVYNFSLVYLSMHSPLNGCFTDYAADIRSIGTQPIMADYDNIHDYPFQGAGPYDSLSAAISRPRTQPSRPFVLTETGYSTGEPQTAHPKLAISETLQAKNLLNAVFASYKLGAKRTYIYELMDNNNDFPATSLEHHYGLFYSSGKPKLAATALHNMSRILADAPVGGVGTIKIPDFKVRRERTQGSTQPPIRELILQKSSGSHVLVLWAEPKIWNASSGTEEAPIKQNVTITFSNLKPTLAVYDPLKQFEAVQTVTNQNMITVQILDHPILIAIQ